TDGLNYGSPERLEVFWQMDQSIQGISEACRELGISVISGYVSMYNESYGEPIFRTPIIGTVCLFESIYYITPNSYQDADDVILVIGESGHDFGGSELQQLLEGEYSGQAPAIDLALEGKRAKALNQAIQAGLVVSAEDISEGGFAVALTKKVVQQDGLGAQVTLTGEQTAALFSETQSRYIVSIKREDLAEFTKLCPDAKEIGSVT